MHGFRDVRNAAQKKSRAVSATAHTSFKLLDTQSSVPILHSRCIIPEATRLFQSKQAAARTKSPEIFCQSSFSLFFLQPLLLRRPTLRFWRHLGNLRRLLWSCLRRHWRLWYLPHLPGFLVRLGHRYRGWGGWWNGRSNWRWRFWWRFWVGSAGCIGINQRNAGSRFNFWWGRARTL